MDDSSVIGNCAGKRDSPASQPRQRIRGNTTAATVALRRGVKASLGRSLAVFCESSEGIRENKYLLIKAEETNVFASREKYPLLIGAQ